MSLDDLIECQKQMQRLAALVSGERSTNPKIVVDAAIALLSQKPSEDLVPTFAIKATDEFAIQTIRAHIRLCWNDNLYQQVDEETLALAEIIAWQRANPDRVHLPDHEHIPTGSWTSNPPTFTEIEESSSDTGPDPRGLYAG